MMAVMACRLDSGVGTAAGAEFADPDDGTAAGTEVDAPAAAGSKAAGPGWPHTSAGHTEMIKASRDAQHATMQLARRALRSFLD